MQQASFVTYLYFIVLYVFIFTAYLEFYVKVFSSIIIKDCSFGAGSLNSLSSQLVSALPGTMGMKN